MEGRLLRSSFALLSVEHQTRLHPVTENDFFYQWVSAENLVEGGRRTYIRPIHVACGCEKDVIVPLAETVDGSSNVKT